MMLIEIVAIALSPVIAVLVSMWIQNRKEKRGQKYWILTTLITNRQTPLTVDNVRALNMIDITFHNSPHVRRLWKELYEMFSNASYSTAAGAEQRMKKNLELIVEIANVLGYKRTISAFDADRTYIPEGLAEQMRKSNELMDELLRVLKASGGIQLDPKPGPN